MQPSRDISRLIEIMAALRRPGTGCGWDIAQTFETIVPYTIEEAYEIADAVARGNIEDTLAAKGTAPGAAALAEMETLWNMAKQSEKRVTP